ncbi:MAG: arginine--tRNA ligase [Verrucomicrobia bacterium]|nr:arginine--tRNA ligase [Verrucomicrobiota bacterium]MDA1086370.1 arginine--tRNA ligase [Verrucomicrobiota bacterium]
MSDSTQQPISTQLTQLARDAFQEVFSGTELDLASIEVVQATSSEFGDYQCNSSLSLAKALKRPPRAIAEAVVGLLEADERVSGIEIAGPGFINFHLEDAWLARHVNAAAAAPHMGVPQIGEGERILMDYGSPNITKPLHIGHLRSHNIGSTLDRVLRFLGYAVTADNHLGDWGTQFGITLRGWLESGDEDRLKHEPMEELERVYVASYERSREDKDWLTECRETLVRLQSGDAECLRIWQRFVDLSIEELDRIYARIGVTYDLVRGESHYHEKLEPMVGKLIDAGLAQPSEGALVVFLEEEKLAPCMVRKSDGGFNYATTDLATLESRVAEFNPSKIIYVTDDRQKLHFQQVFAISRRLGHTVELIHVAFGLMRLPEATFSTREGNVIKLEALLDEAERRAGDVVRESSTDLDSAEQARIAAMVGVGAVKYADLSQNPQSLVTFTWEKALSLDGNSAPYLQYAHARICSVLRKFEERFPEADLTGVVPSLGEPTERDIAVHLARFPECLVSVAETYRPNLLADYLFELAGRYSRFYQNVPFLKAPEGVRESRLRLCQLVLSTLRTGLELLGIQAPDRI